MLPQLSDSMYTDTHTGQNRVLLAFLATSIAADLSLYCWSSSRMMVQSSFSLVYFICHHMHQSRKKKKNRTTDDE